MDKTIIPILNYKIKNKTNLFMNIKIQILIKLSIKKQLIRKASNQTAYQAIIISYDYQ